MSSAFDKDTGFEEEPTDVYQAGKLSDDDDADDELDEPSVEAELAEQESDLLDDKEKKIAKKKTEDAQEDKLKSDLDLIEEAEAELQSERDELLRKDGDENEE